MTRVDNLINMLKEFDYKKNGKGVSIQFLIEMIHYFDETYEYEWDENNGD